MSSEPQTEARATTDSGKRMAEWLEWAAGRLYGVPDWRIVARIEAEARSSHSDVSADREASVPATDADERGTTGSPPATQVAAPPGHSDVSADLPITDTYGLLRELSAEATQGRWFERYGLIHGTNGGIFFGDSPEEKANARFAAYAVNAVRRALVATPSARAEAAPEREGLDVERLARAIHEGTAHNARGGVDNDLAKLACVQFGWEQSYCHIKAQSVAAQYARLAPTSPSSEETDR